MLAALLLAALAPADERLAGKACRSVHLRHPAPPASAFALEMAVTRSAPGSYFMAAGWNKGYFGLQELGGGKKVGLFSVWDPAGGDDPSKIDPAKRVRLLHQGEGVRVSRFGGEGTGGKSMFDFDWKPDVAYRFAVTSRPDGPGRAAYSGYIAEQGKPWRHLVTFSTPADDHRMTGLNSFVEDFRRDGDSAKRPRAAVYGNVWTKAADGGAWNPAASARFTADANPATNVDAGALDGGRYFLATGGDTPDGSAKLKQSFARTGPAGAPPAAPE